MSLPKPYYEDEARGIVIYHGDARDILPHLPKVDLLLTDPPYGIGYSSGMTGHDGGVSLPGIANDADCTCRDFVLEWFRFGGHWAVFGSRKKPAPTGTKAVLIWDKGEHVGMGDLAVPWRPNYEEIYIGGSGWQGHRGSSILRFPAPVTWNSTASGRAHPHEKPVPLIAELLSKSKAETVLDPFMGSGTTLVACKQLGRKCIGIELEERYCEIAARRLAQDLLFDSDELAQL